ncbi:MAG: hypothetical protein RI894_2394 [Bacteroidota bacterium]|jgi:uncharacterized protein (TIGR02646 family)
MLQLAYKHLSIVAEIRLTELQAQIDAIPDFTEKVSEAQRLWTNKTGSDAGKKTFHEVKGTLTEMCIAVKVCNYCEHNEATDIEHIAPKSFFPEFTFVWDNYLLACKTCNTGYKLDKCHVLDPDGNVHEIKRGSGKPPYPTIAMINPRSENPTDFMLLNTATFIFEIIGTDTIAKNKAAKTIEVLDLNNRDTLKEARKSLHHAFYDSMDRLSRIVKADSMVEIEDILRPHEDLIKGATENIDELKEKIKQGYKKYIQDKPHPSVWYAIKTIDSKVHPKWQKLFEIIPEALEW